LLKTTPVWRCGKANKISPKQEIVSFSFTLKTKNVSKTLQKRSCRAVCQTFSKRQSWAWSERAENLQKRAESPGLKLGQEDWFHVAGQEDCSTVLLMCPNNS
jgi:hypothetical protein